MTTMAFVRNGLVNLERALLLGERLGGHLIMGHVTGIGEIKKIETIGDSKWFYLKAPEGFTNACQYKGSIAIDGASLTIAYLKGNTLGVSIIPHTDEKTILNTRKVGAKVNLEWDMLLSQNAEKRKPQNRIGKISQSWLREVGF